MIDFTELYEQHAREVHRYAYFLSGNETVAEDIVSETFVRVWGARDRVELRTVRAYLLAIARNLYLQGKRRSDREGSLPETLPDPARSVDERSSAARELERTLAALQGLPEVDRSAVLMRSEGVSYDEIGATLGLSAATARVRVFRARSKLNLARKSPSRSKPTPTPTREQTEKEPT